MQRVNPALAFALLAGLGAAGGVSDPLGESRRAMTDEFPRATQRLKNSRYMQGFDPAKRRDKKKQAKKSRMKNKKR